MLTDMITYNLCRLLCQHSLCFQSLPHSFSLPLRIFNNLHTLCIVKSDLSPVKSSIAALFPKKQGVYGVPPGMVYLCLPLPACKPSNALVASRVPLRDLQTLPTPVQIAAMACNTLSKPCFSVQEHASPGCRSEKHCRRTARHATMNFRRNCFADDSFV